MASQGDRFRRRALSRGYKVDEVDAFLDRVEATLSGEPMGAPVASQEVDDVVFRVRFGGYDEWQVDVYLDRVARQLAELEDRGVLGRVASPEFASGRPPRVDDNDIPPPRDRDLPGRREAPMSRDGGPPMGGRPDVMAPDGPPMGRPDGPPPMMGGRPDGPPPMMGGRPDPTAPMTRPISSPARDRDLPPMRDEPTTPPPPSRRPEPPQQRGRPERDRSSVEDDGESFAHLRDDGEGFGHLRSGDDFEDPFPDHRRRGTPSRGFDEPDRFDDAPDDIFGGPPQGRFDSPPPAPPMRDQAPPPFPPMREPAGPPPGRGPAGPPPPQRPVSSPPTGPMSPPPGSPPRGWQPTPPGGFDRDGYDSDDMTRPIRRFQDEPEIDAQMTQRLRRGGEDRFMPPPPPVPNQGRIDPERRDPATPPRGMHDPYREPTPPRGIHDPDASTLVHPVVPPQDGPSHPAPTSPAYRSAPQFHDEPPTQAFRAAPSAPPGGPHTPPGGLPDRAAANVDYGRRNPYEGRGVFDNPGRHGREEMTTELRAADSPFTPEDLTRLNQLRQAFQPRRFGSGYDPVQVDRMFDGMSANMTGRSPVPLTDRELDTSQFSLVQGGYFEAEVDAALREVRDIFARRNMVR